MKHLNTFTKLIFKLRGILFAMTTSAACVLTSNALAEGFDTFGDQQRLENQVIIASGNIDKITRTANYSNDTSYFDRQKQTVFEIGQFCFESSDSFEDISGKAGLLLVDQFSNASIGVITQSISSIKIKKTGVIVLDCASLMLQDGNRIRKQLKQQLETLKQQRAILDQMIKDQRAAAKKSP